MAARKRSSNWRIATSAGSSAPRARRSAAPFVVMAPLLVVLVGYGLLPTGSVRDYGYPVMGTLCIAIAFWGLLRNGRPRPTGWLLVLGGFTGWVLGDWTWLVEQKVFGVDAYPAPSDAVYVASYGVMAAGLVIIVRRRGSRGDLPALLDAAILAAGTAVVAGVFVIAPIAARLQPQPRGEADQLGVPGRGRAAAGHPGPALDDARRAHDCLQAPGRLHWR